jgi:hypothetical protein
MNGLLGLRKDMNDEGDCGGGVKRFYSSWGRDFEELECDAHIDAVDRLAVDEDGKLNYYGVSVSVIPADVDRGVEFLEDVMERGRVGCMYQVDVLVFRDYESLKRFSDGEVLIWRVGNKLIVRDLSDKKQVINN